MTLDSMRDVSRVMDNLTPEQTETLDKWSEQLQGGLRTVIDLGGPAAQRVKNLLNGVWLGHALHPALTDVVIGAWVTGAILDVVGKRRSADAALTLGVVAAVPTALSGAADWADTPGEPRRTGLVHAMLNSAGLGCMVLSLLARRAEMRPLGFVLSSVGLSLASFSAWIGGELVYRWGVAVNRSAFLPTVSEFQRVVAYDSLQSGQLHGAELTVEGVKVPVVLLRTDGSVLAIGAQCSHWGGPLAEGELVGGDCVQCPWHGSQFSMYDGSVVQGPASVGQPVFETRVRDRQVEVRQRH